MSKYFKAGYAGSESCYVLKFSSLSTRASIVSTVWCTESSRLDEVYINSVTSELCACTRGDVKVKLLLFTDWLDDQIPLLSPPFSASLRCGRFFNLSFERGRRDWKEEKAQEWGAVKCIVFWINSCIGQFTCWNNVLHLFFDQIVLVLSHHFANKWKRFCWEYTSK